MKDKEELLAAIENYTIFTRRQRKLLHSLLTVANEDYKAIVTVNDLAVNSGLTPAAVYNSIKLFTKDNILQLAVSANNKINGFILNESRLREIQAISNNLKKIK